MNNYIKLNAEPLIIEYIERDETHDFEPAFIWDGNRYFINDFTRIHNNPWIGGTWPDYIHGVETNNYYNPLFIEIVSSDCLNIYQETSA